MYYGILNQNYNINIMVKSNQVTIRLSKTGETVRTSKNPLYGYIVAEQKGISVVNGWAKDLTLSTIIQGEMPTIKAMEASFPMTGKIVVKESLEPFNTNNPAVDIKYAGDTGVACSVKGLPIYRTTFFTADVNAVSELLKHDNGAQIREANSKGQAVESLQALKAEPVEAEASPF
jgi:hypothetical protein|tara:strand:- start:4166 stop:4690 length:525 start_codon:yes stop_codon:yes gene_type:complete